MVFSIPGATDCASGTQHAMGILSEVTVYAFGVGSRISRP